ncbi:unnamed protein product [Miscanthus lutarioriparius]|uniref:Uncharacterized protein n=1 Tax=Miscanthus lutarioriparius TaxID=422564 RepID=A0A811Q4S5_9POAL|nr:unnamed protein product [Miscanthus lutarioriparius]
MSSGGGSDRPGSGAGRTVKTPSDFLKSIRGHPVVVKLNSGVDYREVITCKDIRTMGQKLFIVPYKDNLCFVEHGNRDRI